MTEKQSKMETGAIIEEESSNLVSSAERPDNSSKTSAVIPVPEGHEEPALYNDFLGRQQTQVQRNQSAALEANGLSKISEDTGSLGQQKNVTVMDGNQSKEASMNVSIEKSESWD